MGRKKRIVLREINEESAALASAERRNLRREPLHVVYGGAHLFKFDTTQKLGKIALESMRRYAPNFAEFARAMWLRGADSLPQFFDVAEKLEKSLARNAAQANAENAAAMFALEIYRKTIDKLEREPVEDFRIDFEDGYGFRTDEEEDRHAVQASSELAKSFSLKTISPFCGFRIKSFAPETYERATKTLNLFLENLLEKTNKILPENFVVTLPKITGAKQIKDLRKRLEKFERKNKLAEGSIKIEVMIETPPAIVNEKGNIPLGEFIKAGKGRITSAHFGAYDYTASLGIAAHHQHLNHEACKFARRMMQISLAPLGVRLSDSVTTEMPVAVHKGENLTAKQIAENKFAVHKAWRLHFNNVTNSQIDSFYQSWDLHPAQLVARYAAVYAFFSDGADEQAKRLKGFIDRATQANLTGNIFDDAASAQGILNFFVRALNCGALTESEITAATNLTANQLQTKSFVKIMESLSGRS